MVSNITSGTGAARRSGDSVETQDQIAGILAKIKSLRKRVTELQRQLMKETDPAVRMALMREIEDVQRTIEMLQQQIMALETAERRRAANRLQAQRQMKDEA